VRTFGKLILAAVFVFAVLQFVRPALPAKPATAEIQAPPDVKQILDKDCYSCHSDERRLAWFDQIVPGYWLVRHDILTAREHLNFSTLGSKPAASQKAALYEAVNTIQLGDASAEFPAAASGSEGDTPGTGDLENVFGSLDAGVNSGRQRLRARLCSAGRFPSNFLACGPGVNRPGA
jgi:hypothetical protein